MPSTYTSNLGIELPADGELDGVWGDVVNDNMNILDRGINGSLTLTLTGTSSTLTTTDGALSDGQYKLLILGGSPSGTHTITLAPNDAQKIYFVQNNTNRTVEFNQGSGANASILAGDSGVIYSDGGGAGGIVYNLTDNFGMSSVNITGGSITGLADLSLSAANPSITFLETDTTDTDARIRLNAGDLLFETVTDAGAQVRENMRIESGGNVGIGTGSPQTALEVSSDTNPTAAFIAYISGTTMTVTGITSGALAVGDRVFGAGVEWNTVITAQLTGTTGASGTYSVNNSQTVSTAPTGIAMDSSNAGKSVLRLANTDTTESANQTTGGIEFFSSDASTPGAGVKGYVAVISETATPDSAMIFGTSNNTASTLAVERMRIDSVGNVGIGTKNPTVALHVVGDARIEGANSNLTFAETDTTDTDARVRLNGGTLLFETVTDAGAQVRENITVASTGNVAIDTDTLFVDAVNNRVGVGKTSPTVALDVVGAANFTGNLTIENTGPNITFAESDTTNTDHRIRVAAGDLIFETVTDAGVQVRENMRIASSDEVSIGGTVVDPASSSDVGFTFSSNNTLSIARASNGCLNVGRQTDDGTLATFRQAGTTEGSISVSGTTVSYNGGHLSRWAQFPDNSRPTLLKGTVMSNLDQMSVWGDEDNEQLNCVQVSTVAGDANVAGVFVAWDSEDDGYNDILLAMTGDMVIRIAAGTTVQRGDLLMSAGDGTAKPQGDDIVRSKTIAKVTSTHVSHNYADGSYAVPCVLMAC